MVNRGSRYSLFSVSKIEGLNSGTCIVYRRIPDGETSLNDSRDSLISLGSNDLGTLSFESLGMYLLGCRWVLLGKEN